MLLYEKITRRDNSGSNIYKPEKPSEIHESKWVLYSILTKNVTSLMEEYLEERIIEFIE